MRWKKQMMKKTAVTIIETDKMCIRDSEVTDEDVNNEIEAVRKRNARMVVVERPAKEGDTVLPVSYTHLIEKAEHQRDVYASAVNVPKEKGMLKDGDCVIITAGVPLLVRGNTNLMRIHIVGNKLA